MEAHRVVRRRGSHIFYAVDLQMAVRLFPHKVQLISYDVEEVSLKHMKLLGLEDRMYYQYILANL
jgi:hypothetical protein